MPVFILSSIILILTLGQLVRIDLREHRLPDHYTLPLIWAGLGTNALAQRALPTEAIWGAILGYVVFWLIGAVYFRSRGQEGLGLGDAKLLAAAGAWVGVLALPWVVLLSALGALGYAVLSGHGRKERLAFGPWIAGALLLIWFGKGLFSGV
ncbi:A24 family peptidase [Sulfitobacter litoralis]|jgi:prepilin signal peptidase PulO-like enzyme (type II secretory pathway)|uniref:prepilin peptidase n=1 Tax=Sulfitobacter litoralis TaxID=335975 RepID=UPI002B266CC7|nr:A24 family peptidase [Sulfitobacter litoralis]